MSKKNLHTGKRRALLFGVVLLTAAATGALGWRWAASLTCRQIDVAGTRHADTAALVALARVDTGMVLFDIDPAIVADRVRRHPWVRTASATRLPTGTLRIDVEERVPAVLVLDARGRPSVYLDRDAFPMPLGPDAVYDVPLLRGVRRTPHMTQPVGDPAIRRLVAAVAALDPAANALLSDVTIDAGGEAWVYTTPGPGLGAIPVRLGDEDYAGRLARLQTFWQRGVLTQPQKRFTLIDLRFDSQVVTKEVTHAKSEQP